MAPHALGVLLTGRNACGDAETCATRQIHLRQCVLAIHGGESHLTNLGSVGVDRAADHQDRSIGLCIRDLQNTGGRHLMNVINARRHGGPSHCKRLRSLDSDLARRRGASQTGYKQSKSDGQNRLFQIETLLRFWGTEGTAALRLRHLRPLWPDQCIQEIALFAENAPERGACSLFLRGGTSAALFRGGSGVMRSVFRLENPYGEVQ